MGSGKMMVEFFSADMVLSVCAATRERKREKKSEPRQLNSADELIARRVDRFVIDAEKNGVARVLPADSAAVERQAIERSPWRPP